MKGLPFRFGGYSYPICWYFSFHQRRQFPESMERLNRSAVLLDTANRGFSTGHCRSCARESARCFIRLSIKY